MKYLIISDLHENYPALLGALDAAEQFGGYDDIWFLGDALGHCDDGAYCAAAECLYLLREKNAVCIIGNWEGWLLQPEKDDISHQIPHSSTLQGLREMLPPDLLDYVKSWNWLIERDGFTLTHGCPYQRYDDDHYRAEPWEDYLRPIDTPVVGMIFSLDRIKTRHLVVGHTHQPGYFHYNGSTARWRPLTPDLIEREIYMDSYGGRYVLNPGSISDNRENAPWPTALLLDTQECYFRFLKLSSSRRY